MREPELPMTKSALDRLGTRLAAGNRVSNADLEKLAAVAAVCQRVLNEAKAELATLGYQATTRVKTTGTLVEKQRRESARLSQVQDLAGARIIVPHRPAQDDALVKIRNHFEASGHRCREIDRRKDPRYGYRAVHLVVAVGPILIEIQVRTELEDTWAQIVERLSDRWGRGIRYGETPAEPDAMTRLRAGERVLSRREALAVVIRLSDSLDGFELVRSAMLLAAELGETFRRLMRYAAQFAQAQDPRRLSELPPDERASAEMMVAGLELAEHRQLPGAFTESSEVTIPQLVGRFRGLLDSLRDESAVMLLQAHNQERELRDTLQAIAAAADGGE